jgi:SAM-dependent methyltransferase
MIGEPNAAGKELSEDDLVYLLFGHAAFQYFHAGFAFRIFELLAASPEGLTREAISQAAGLQAYPARCLLLGLTSLRLIVKRGEVYANSRVIQSWISSERWKMLHDTVMFEARIVYQGQTDFVDSLRENRNVGLRHLPGGGPDLYHRLAVEPDLQQVFYNYMGSWSRMANPLLLASVDFSRWGHLLDVGGGDAANAIDICKRYPAAMVSLLDLPGNGAVARERVAAANLNSRIRVIEGNMFRDPFPAGNDCILFIHQLVIWPLATVSLLLKKAYDALAPGGGVVIFSSITDDSEDGPLMAAPDSVYFVSIPARGGMIHTWSDYEAGLREAGFSSVTRHRCRSWTPHGAMVAVK